MCFTRSFFNHPVIAQLVERRTVEEYHTVILRSVVRIRFAGIFFKFVFYRFCVWVCVCVCVLSLIHI